MAYGHDFVGDGYDGTNSFLEDADPMDNCNGHGTHVAGKCNNLTLGMNAQKVDLFQFNRNNRSS